MRRTVIAVCVSLICATAGAQPLDMAREADALNGQAKSKIAWNTKQAKRADVTCDGKSDSVMYGADRDNVWVGIVSGSGSSPQILKFGNAKGSQDSFCAAPVSIEIYPHNCLYGENEKLPDCRPAKMCRAFQVSDGQCDSFNFYWNEKLKRLDWWRN